MRMLTLLLRTLFGLAFTVIGLNGVLMACDMAFMPQPADLPAPAAAFMQAMSDTRYMLPLIGGTQLAGALRRRRPDLPIVLVSGYTGPLLAERALAVGVTEILRKPFQTREIAAALARALKRA